MRSPVFRLLIGYFALFSALYAPLLLGVHVYNAGDTLGFNYPALKALQPFSINSLLSDPLSGRGFPWLVTYGTLSPIAHALRLIFNEYQTLAWLVYIYFSLGAFFMAVFLRRGGRSDAASFIGGLVYVVAFFSIGDGDYPLASSLPIFSALLLILQNARRKPFLKASLVALVVIYGWLGGHFNFVPLIIIGSGVYALWHFYNKNHKPFYVLLAGTSIGTLSGLVKLIPALAYVQLSERAGGISAAVAGAGSLSISSIYTAIFPYLRLPVLGGHAGEFFFGALPLALLFAGLISRDKKIRLSVFAWLTTILIALPHSPLYWFIQQFPFLSYLRGPTRWLLVGYAPLAFIVAWAVDASISGKLVEQRKKVARGALYIGAVALAFTLIFTVTNLFAAEKLLNFAKEYFDANLYAKTSGLPLEHYHNYIENTWDAMVSMFSLLSLRYLVPLLGILITGWYVSKKKLEAGKLIILTIFTSFVPFFLYHEKVSTKTIVDVENLYEQSDLENGYMMSILPGLAHFMETTKSAVTSKDRLSYSLALLQPNTHALIGVLNADFYQPIQPRRMARLLASIGSGNAPVPLGENLSEPSFSPEERLKILGGRSNLFSILNISHVVSAWNLPEPFVFERDMQPVDQMSPIHIYSVPGTRPIIYAAKKVKVMSPNEDRAMKFLRNLDDPEMSLIECKECPGVSGGGAKINIIEDGDLSLVFDVNAENPVWIVVSRPRIPGWRVTIDGAEVDTAIANGMFFGVPVDAGNHRVGLSMTYGFLFADSLEILF